LQAEGSPGFKAKTFVVRVQKKAIASFLNELKNQTLVKL